MPGGHGPPFKVDQVPRVPEQIYRLAQRAKAAGIGEKYLAALNEVVRLLREDPLRWGDPVRHTHHESGLVQRGLYDPLLVNYVVYEPEGIVCILDIVALPNSALE